MFAFCWQPVIDVSFAQSRGAKAVLKRCEDALGLAPQTSSTNPKNDKKNGMDSTQTKSSENDASVQTPSSETADTSKKAADKDSTE